MLRRLYIQLLWAHPAQFRYRFCDEMLEIFDQAHGRRERLWLLADGLISMIRQWTIRPEFRQPWPPVAACSDTRDLLAFHLFEPYKPSRFAMMQGGLAAVILIFGVVLGMGQGPRLAFAAGAHYARPSLFPVAFEAAGDSELNLTVKVGTQRQNPWRPLARSYFKSVPVLAALDKDGDLVISGREIAAAPAALRKLDPGHNDAPSMREHPVPAALDSNHDGVISDAEIANSPAALRKLDLNHDGILTAVEVMPDGPEAQAAVLLTWFGGADGSISRRDLSAKEAWTFRGLLSAADRNGDGRATRAEPKRELARRWRR